MKKFNTISQTLPNPNISALDDLCLVVWVSFMEDSVNYVDSKTKMRISDFDENSTSY